MKVRLYLSLAFLFLALLLIAFFGTSLLTFPISFLYRNAPNLSTARSVAQIAALLAGVGLFIGAAILAIAVALKPGNFTRKVLYALPLFTLGFLLAAVILNAMGIGVDAALFMPGFSITTAFVATGTILCAMVFPIAAARERLSDKTIKTALAALGISAVPALVTVVAMILSVAIVSTTQPSARFPGGPGGANEAQQQGAAARASSAPQISGTGIAPSEQTGQPGTGTRAAPGNSPQRQGEGSAAQGAAGPGGLSPAGTVSRFQTGGALTSIFLILGLVTTVGGWRALRSAPAQLSAQIAPVNVKSKAGRVVLACVAIGAALLVVIQLVPVQRTNPPVKTTVQWDSPQTQALAQHACMDCHSNETQWQWYSYIAPASWINVLDVNAARERWNLSDLGSTNRSRLAGDMAENIRNGTMPPKDYLMMHPQAQLSAAEKQQLIQGLQASISQ